MKSATPWPRRLLSCVIVLLLLATNFPGRAADSGRLRALILSGGGTNDWRASSAFLRELLLESGRFDVRVNEAPDGITPKSLDGFDVVVDAYAGPELGKSAEKVLWDFVGAGKGLVMTHDALSSGRTQPGFVKVADSSRVMDVPFRRFELKYPLPTHPVVQGLKSNWRTADRPVRGLVAQSGTDVLAIGDENEPVLFAAPSRKGRIFGTALGHDAGSMQERAFLTTFLRGAEWAASGKVTLPAEISMPGPDTNGVRVLVITGGHDHETSFYGLFDGYKDLGWVAVNDSNLAFTKDIRSKYDVLVFYDFTRDMDDKSKQNLRDFVESGKGIVVLHHGILNFQKWPWWYEEVVGGLYRLERLGTIPNSTVKFGEQHLITPAGQHPITAGIEPFQVSDETYKGLFISDKVTPLLTTDNPTSDRTVAWVGPCTTSKVVFIQLGHDHSPFRHPSYRAVVHNSILWTAGKLK